MSQPSLVMTSAGAIPTPVSQLRSDLVDSIQAVSPGFMADLPGTLIEDIVSTGVSALAVMDQARVDSINSLNPFSANPFVLGELGLAYGLPQNQPTNTSVSVIFTGTVGFLIPSGFIVSDGTYQYTVQESATIPSGGSTGPVFTVATQSGSWTPLPDTVTTLVTSVPAGVTLTVDNPNAGTPSQATESTAAYRLRLLQAANASVQSTPALIKTELLKVPGVDPRLVSVVQTSGSFQVIVGGGDPFSVASAIYQSTDLFPSLTLSTTPANNVTATIQDGGDTYTISFVRPMQQSLQLAVTWATNLTNFTSSPLVNQQGQQAIQTYVNTLPVGDNLNLLQLEQIFIDAVSGLLPVQFISDISFVVTLNGTVVVPAAGTQYIAVNTEAYLYSAPGDITVSQ